MAPDNLNDVVLLVDDSPAILETLSFVLEAAGFPTITAHDGTAGMEAALLHRPRVVVVDANMPGMNGYDVCSALRMEPDLRLVYIIFITGETEDAIRRRAIDAGADLYVQKPVDEELLTEVVRDVFSGERRAGCAEDARLLVRSSRRDAN